MDRLKGLIRRAAEEVPRTWGKKKGGLLKLGSNFSMGGHTNTIGEEQLVLKGEIQSNGETYGQGSYRFIPKRSSHDSWRSNKGAVVLARWD
jgi:hypothetical protein